MATYRIRDTGEYPVSENELRSRFPSTSMPAVIGEGDRDALGVDVVFPTPQPAVTNIQIAREIAPSETPSGWQQEWEVVDRFATPEEAAAYLAAEAEAARVRVLLPLSFRRRLDAATLLKITLSASQALAAGDATLQVFLDDLSSARQVELDNPDTQAAVAVMRDAGLLTAQEETALLADANETEAAAIRAAGIL